MTTALVAKVGSRMLALTDKGRKALLLDELGVSLPQSFAAWGASDSPYCNNGHQRLRPGRCGPCAQMHHQGRPA